MSIADLSRKGAVADTSEITCPHYDAPAGEKRCRHYLKNGACSRPDEFMCTEWLKANGHVVPPADQPSGPDSTRVAETSPQPRAGTDLFGNPVPDPEPPARPAQPPPPAAARPSSDEQLEQRPLRGLTTEDIDSFKELNVEVCLRSEAFGEVWLVPEYTGRDRKEITPEHAATICHVLQAFPGSQVVSFEKSPKTDEETEA